MENTANKRDVDKRLSQLITIVSKLNFPNRGNVPLLEDMPKVSKQYYLILNAISTSNLSARKRRALRIGLDRKYNLLSNLAICKFLDIPVPSSEDKSPGLVKIDLTVSGVEYDMFKSFNPESEEYLALKTKLKES